MVSTLSQISSREAEGVLHADMAHGNAIANTDGRNQHRGAARHADACLDGIGQLIQVHMAGKISL